MQQLIEAYDQIILQFPIYWFNCPPLMKRKQVIIFYSTRVRQTFFSRGRLQIISTCLSFIA
ncbi:NAD(P)H-dependent oxidoreductase [Enterococcus silesiacus]|uniref:NAD(P)H-dependent oxidoreductase n=1 Tax=Enterococcus silesiacus TaxID=332949 RepID=UPI0009001F1A